MKRGAPTLLFAVLTACNGSTPPLEPPPRPGPPLAVPPSAAAPVPPSVEATPTSPAVDAAAAVQPSVPAGETSAVGANNAFAARLYEKLCDVPGNLFVSPLSISTALAMTYAGARGETRDAMAKTLAFALSDEKVHAEFGALQKRLVGGASKGPEIRIANRLWTDKTLRAEPAFVELTRGAYGAGFGQLDFIKAPEPARVEINRWVSNATKGKIAELLPQASVDSTTRVVLTNAVYFKGVWQTQFAPSATRPEPFFLDGGKTIDVPMMHAKLRARHTQTVEAQTLELPYDSGGSDRTFDMIVILPNSDVPLAKLEQRLGAGSFDALLGSPAVTQVDVTLPRFRITWARSLNQPLKDLGMSVAFDDRADFTGIAREDLLIDLVQHQAFVEVNEVGTEAAAATAVVVRTKSLPPPTPVFRADRPFLFAVRDTKSGALLFMGRVADPSKAR